MTWSVWCLVYVYVMTHVMTMYVMLRHIKKKGKNKGQTTIVATVVSLLESRERCAIYNDDSKIKKIQNEATVERGEIKKKEDNDAIYIFTTEAI